MLTSACATLPVPRNVLGAQYQPTEQVLPAGQGPSCIYPPPPAAIDGLTEVPVSAFADAPDILAAGDRLRLIVAGDKDVLSRDYVVAANGALVIEGNFSIAAAGRTRDELERDLRARFIAAGLVLDVTGNVRLQHVESTAIPVSVEGAVFQPGNTTIGERANDAHSTAVANAAQGDFNRGRNLTTAIQQAGGVRPDAGIGAIYLLRGRTFTQVDLRTMMGDAFAGGGVAVNPELARGDRIIVPSLGCFRPELVRPSPLTAPGVRVFMSNLTRTATSNSAAGINHDSTSLPYGTRLLQGLVAANCVGGSTTNAERSAVLISRNPINGRSIVIQRQIEELVRHAHRDERDPYLLPGDALACYDSKAMTVVDAIGVIGSALTPLIYYKTLTQ